MTQDQDPPSFSLEANEEGNVYETKYDPTMHVDAAWTPGEKLNHTRLDRVHSESTGTETCKCPHTRAYRHIQTYLDPVRTLADLSTDDLDGPVRHLSTCDPVDAFSIDVDDALGPVRFDRSVPVAYPLICPQAH